MQSSAVRRLVWCRAGLRIASEQNRRQVGARWLVVKADGHQGHWLDNTKAILKAPAKQSGIARRHKNARPLEFPGFGDQCLQISIRLADCVAEKCKGGSVGSDASVGFGYHRSSVLNGFV